MGILTEGFIVGDSIDFSVAIALNGVAADIRADTVTLTLTDEVDAVQLTATADVVTSGLTGTAIFTITAAATEDVTPGNLWLKIKWTRSTGQVNTVVSREIRARDK